MSRNLSEGSTSKDVAANEFQTRQLLRRPAPPSAAATGSQYPMSYDVIPFDVFAYGPDKEAGSGWSFPTFDATYMRGYYVQKNSSTGEFIRYFRLGPKGSIWSISFVMDVGPDCGKIEFSWQTISEDAPNPPAVGSYDLNGLGMIGGSTDRSAITYYTCGTSTFDAYSAGGGTQNSHTGFSQFRIMGDDGAPITSNGTAPVGDDGENHFDGGAGIWILKVKNITKNALSSGNRITIEDMWVRRNTSDGFPA